MFEIKWLFRGSVVFSCLLLFLLPFNSSLATTVSSQFDLSGYLVSGSPSSFDLAALQNYATNNASAVKSVSVSNSTGGTDVYTGISLGSFLSTYLKTDPTVPKNDILRDYVVATGTDGYRSVFSLGELNSSFGNQNDIIAYQLNGADLTSNGFARIIAPGDVKAGRWVSNLASLELGHIDYIPASGGVSDQFTVDGAVTTLTTYNASNLPGSLGSSVVTVNTRPLTGSSFTGVSLWSLLNQAGIVTDPNIKNDILSKYVIATGSDGYQSVFSLGELNPNFGNQADLVAYADGTGASLGAAGFARTVVPGDVLKAGRYVSNLTALTVVNVAAVPLPSAAWLMVSSLFTFRCNAYRRRIKSVA